MSLEAKIEALTAAVLALTAQLQSQPVAAPQVAQVVVPQQPAPVPAPAPDYSALVPTPIPTPAPAAAPQMPAPPSFMTPPVAAAPAVPFSDIKGLITYMTQAYGTLGPEKGAQMQNILTSLGYANVNDVKPEHFPVMYQQIEALKAQ